MDEEAARMLALLDARLPSLHDKVVNLSGEQRQLVAIAQVMIQPAQLVIIDNPGRLLSLPYQEKLLHLIRQWQEQGRAVLFSSTNLDHLFAVSDRVLVLRDSQLVTDVRADETNTEEIVAALVEPANGNKTPPSCGPWIAIIRPANRPKPCATTSSCWNGIWRRTIT